MPEPPNYNFHVEDLSKYHDDEPFLTVLRGDSNIIFSQWILAANDELPSFIERKESSNQKRLSLNAELEKMLTTEENTQILTIGAKFEKMEKKLESKEKTDHIESTLVSNIKPIIGPHLKNLQFFLLVFFKNEELGNIPNFNKYERFLLSSIFARKFGKGLPEKLLKKVFRGF